jgi:hypothetical protein
MEQTMTHSAFSLSRLVVAVALAAVIVPPAVAQIQVINIVPNSQSNEVGIDSEPNLAVDPSNPQRMAASAFTPDPMGGALAPIYVSTDGGITWTLNSTVPDNNLTYGTGDITLRFGGSSSVLYTGILRGNDFLHLEVLRAPDFALSTPMQHLYDRFDEDQPYVQATTVLGGAGTGNDRVYIGNNNLSASQSATIDDSLDAATAAPPANFSPFAIDTRPTSGQDAPPIRPAIHADGTVYGVFYHWTAFSGTEATADVVVVRADGWGTGATPFNALVGTGALAGKQVVTGVAVPWGAGMGQNRFVGSNVTIAVDPRNSDVAYVAWADHDATSDYTLHVRRSADRGNNWSSSDILRIATATNPSLAVNTRGHVGFLYQQLTGSGSQRWQTHLRRSTNNGITWSDDTLADTPADTPTSTSSVYLGDYDHLTAVGKDFYGIFSAANMPVLANFPSGVVFQRNADFGTGTLRDVTNTTTVGASIDPYFFHATDTAPGDDYYVRDWTTSATSFDQGQEPSTNPYFYVDSDVWNQRTSTAKAFNGNDQPVNESAGNDTGPLGDNFMFARVHRKAVGPAGTVILHFLYANFGAGLNYQDAGTAADPTLAFSAASVSESMATGYPWHLDPTTSTHLCLGVEITGPNDAFVPPTLAGSSPGWPTTDLRILNDNNKAQRNIQVLPTGTGASGSVTGWAIAHNAATFRRTMILRYEVPREVQQRFGKAQIQIPNGEALPVKTEGVVRLENMEPGENRWLRVTFDGTTGENGEIVPLAFFEMVGNTPVNGFAIAPRRSPLRDVVRNSLELHRSVFTRVAALFGNDEAKKESTAARLLLDSKISGVAYEHFVKDHSQAVSDALRQAWEKAGWRPLPGAPLFRNDVAFTADAHLSALNDLDAALTAVQLAAGDPADILQNVRWQEDLYRRMGDSDAVLKASRAFIDGYTARKLTERDYPSFLRSLLDSFQRTANLKGGTLVNEAADIERHLDSPRAAQKAHRAFLLALQNALQ